MKKITAALAALVVISCLAGCAKKEADAPAETSAVITTAAAKAETTTAKATETIKAETTAKAEETTAAATEAETEAVTEAVSEEAVTEAETAADNTAETEGGTLTAAVLEKMKSWKQGNVVIEGNISQNGFDSEIYVNTYGDKLSMKMSAAGMFNTRIIYDGKTTYTVSDPRKNYSKKDAPPDDDDNPANEILIGEEYAGSAASTGKETIDGKEYTYEAFEQDGEEMRYYFNDKGELCYVGAYTDGELKIMEFRVTFLEAPDESVFAAPEGYEEISEDDMATQMLIDLFGAIASLGESGGFGDFGDINTEGSLS